MNRRELLVRISAMIAAGSLGIKGNLAFGQPLEIITVTLNTRPWRDINEFRRLRRLAYSFAYLRLSSSSTPERYTEPADFRRTVLGGLQNSFSVQRNQTISQHIADVSSALDNATNRDSLHRHMTDKLRQNHSAFSDWLTRLGITQPLQDDFLRAQALFTVVAAIREGRITTMSFFSNLTWIYPFC